jgi:hypothetical protein
MPQKTRRIVTGHDKNGKAVFLFDGEATNARSRSTGRVSTLLWVTDTTPAELSDRDNADREIGTPPPPAGSIFRVLEIPPEGNRSAEETAALVAEIRRTGEHMQPGLQRDLDARHPGMHRTESVDYALVLKGEIDLLLDDSETHVKAGDVVIMQGTYHAWANRSTEPCLMAFVLIGANVPWKK